MKTINQILKLVKENKKFLISTHVNPDGDAISSAVSVALWLKAQGKTATVVGEETVPAQLSFMPKSSLLKSVFSLKRISYDVAIILDCGDISRIGRVEKVLDKDKPIINIDHHVTNTKFGQVNHILPDQSSTAEVLFSIFKTSKVTITKDMAQLLYVGIMTDTGSFGFDCTTAYTHEVVAELMQHKFSVADLHQKVRETATQADAKMFASIIDHIEFLLDGQVACLVVRRALEEKFSDDFDLKDKLFAFLRTIKGIELMIIFSELGKKKTRINFRSRSKVDVAKLASLYNGGGHKRAAGATADLSYVDAKKDVFKKIKKVL